MSLPFIVDSLDAIKEEHRALYIEENGKFRLDLEGYEDPKGLKSALQSERDAAKNAKLELQKLQKQFEGIDPEIVKKVFAQIDQDEEAKLIAEGKVNEVIQKRTEKMREEHEKLLKAEKERADKAEAYAQKFKQSVIQSQIVQAAVELEALPEATADIAFLAQSKFALDENGKAVAVDENGTWSLVKMAKQHYRQKSGLNLYVSKNRISGQNQMVWVHQVATIQKVSQTFSKQMAR